MHGEPSTEVLGRTGSSWTRLKGTESRFNDILPQQPGVRLAKWWPSNAPKIRWQVWYDLKVDYPRSHSRHGSNALAECLEWVWDVHKQWLEDKKTYVT